MIGGQNATKLNLIPTLTLAVNLQMNVSHVRKTYRMDWYNGLTILMFLMRLLGDFCAFCTLTILRYR